MKRFLLQIFAGVGFLLSGYIVARIIGVEKQFIGCLWALYLASIIKEMTEEK